MAKGVAKLRLVVAHAPPPWLRPCYECSLPENDVRASFSSFFFSFRGAGLLMSFHGHSCPSIMIICIQPQTWGESGSGCGNGASVFFFVVVVVEQLGWCPPGNWWPKAYSAYRERWYCLKTWWKFKQSMLTVLSLAAQSSTEHYLESQPQRRREQWIYWFI